MSHGRHSRQRRLEGLLHDWRQANGGGAPRSPLQCISEWGQDPSGTKQESAVEINRSKEALQLLHHCRLRERADGSGLIV